MAVQGHQLVVGSALNDASFVHDAYLRRVSDCRQAVGYDQSRAVLHEAVEGLLHELLALAVEGRGGLVEDEDRRIFQYGARYRWPPLRRQPRSPIVVW